MNLFDSGKKNFVFLGEAGTGKSEIALNFAGYLKQFGKRQVHFFDMDMTKPLFRSRDTTAKFKSSGIIFHYEEQFMDAPTLVGGVNRLLKDPDCYVVLDVGGDYMGARAVGGFAPLINHQACNVYYVLNPYRPWSYDMDHIDLVLGSILGVAHIKLENLHLISNPNIGKDTTAAELEEGHRKLTAMVTYYKPLDFVCSREELIREVAGRLKEPVMPLHLYLNYLWEEREVNQQDGRSENYFRTM